MEHGSVSTIEVDRQKLEAEVKRLEVKIRMGWLRGETEQEQEPLYQRVEQIAKILGI